MKRFLLAALAFAASCLVASATHLTVEYSGASIPKKYVQNIERTLVKELDFYGPLGLGASLMIRVHVFKDKDEADVFLRQNYPTYVGGRIGGMFEQKTQTAYIMSTDNLDSACKTVTHEISHFLYRKVKSTGSPICFNEGLAEYFGYLKVKKDGSSKSEIDPGDLGTLKTAMMVGEFDLNRYLYLKYSEFNDISRHDAYLPYSVCHIIVATMFDKVGERGVREIIGAVSKKTSPGKAIDSLYPGGRKGLEGDIAVFIGRQ